MKLYLLTTLVLGPLILFTQPCVGQLFATFDDYTGSWADPLSWDSGPPFPLESDIADNIDVNGYITSNSSLSFANVNSAKDLNIFDTLVIHGNMTFANKAHNLNVGEGALLVVFGDFSATNKITVSSGGTIAITGSMTFSPSGSDSFENTGEGKLYVGGSVTGNEAAGSIDEHPDSLANSADPGELALYSFITGGGETPLPVTLGHFAGGVSKSTIILEWQTLSEENFDYFEVQRSADGATFGTIGRVKGNGFTFEPHNYTFTDTQPVVGFNYYRLNAVDFDGSSEVFQVIMIEKPPDFSNVRLYPNPSDGVSLRVDIPEILLSHSAPTLVISDLNGRNILRQKVTGQSTLASFHSKLPDGMYVATLITDRNVHTITIIIH